MYSSFNHSYFSEAPYYTRCVFSLNNQSPETEKTSCVNRHSLFVLFYSFRNSTNAVGAGNSENVHRSSPGSIKQLFNRKFSNLDAGKHSHSYNNNNDNHKTSTVQTVINDFHRTSIFFLEVYYQPQKIY